MKTKLILALGCALATALPAVAAAQCATGVDTGGGNCVPPEALGVNGSEPSGNAAPLPSWENRWGAVVVDNSSGNAGVAKDMPDRSTAVSKATSDCRSDGSSHCEVVAAYRNTCVAVSVAPRFYGHATNIDLEKAKATAMTECAKGGTACTLLYSACSYPVHIR
ncbi:DUF4189 domain-containing protein [Bacillus sp. NP157]|nr:DUF4189 domain-containing protein [Bacillus sp. NP157]